MNKVEASKAAKHFFKTYPSVNTFHVTEDGQFFQEKHHAEAHANTVNKKAPVVHVVERNEEPVNDAPPAPAAPAELTEEQKQAKADADAKAAEEKKSAAIKKGLETKAKNAAAKQAGSK